MNFPTQLRRWGLLLIVTVAVMGMAGAIAYWSGQPAPINTTPQALMQVLAAPTVSPLETPITRYGVLDPALRDALDYVPSRYGNRDDEEPRLPPVGVYLPRTGNMQFEPLRPTQPPTPLPFATPEPLPLPPLAILPTPVPQPTDEATALVYGGDNCAPQGNPVAGILTQRFHRFHRGIDIGVPTGTPVLATHSGTVLYADWSEIGYGYLVVVGNGRFITYYAHNSAFNVQAGATIAKDSVIAFSGSTGNSTGPHVHYETRIDDVPVNPLTFDERGYDTC